MIQTRSEVNGLSEYPLVKDAFNAAKKDGSIWKISFDAEDGSRVRLVEINGRWVFESIFIDEET